MKRINIVFEYDYEDVDIMLVPDEIADNIEAIVREFNTWLYNPENRHRFLIENADGTTVLGIGSLEFLWWLNNYRIRNDESAMIIEQHTSYCPQLPMADF